MLSRSDSLAPEARLLKSPSATPSHPSAKLTSLSLSFPRIWPLVASLSFLLLLLSFRSVPSQRFHVRRHAPPLPPPAAPACGSGKIYVYDLPSKFNVDLLADCDGLNPWSSRCAALSNAGFGPAAADLAGVIPDSLLPSFYATDQFAAEVIFHRRILHHGCRTNSTADASAFYIPFYAGLAVGKHLWGATPAADRDRLCSALLRWMEAQPPFARSNGSDHFITLGRITWDFRRSRDADWGGSFLYMPGMDGVTRLLIERNPWDPRDIGVPYPTGFHPKTANQVLEWQNFVLNRTRSTLFGFAGAARSGLKGDFRAILLKECKQNGSRCRNVDCGGGRCGNRSAEAVSLFLDSEFCLQPRGDSFTRRSMFDCMVAGAVPVLFWKRSAYVQYGLYLPGGEGSGEWSVFVDRREVRSGAVSVRKVLEGIGEERVRRMRERVVEMIPRLVYGGAEDGIAGGMRDAFDVAVEGVMRRFRNRRRGRGRREMDGEDW